MIERISGSFRDPAGFVYRHGETLLRQVNLRYKEHYEFLLDSGLYDELVAAGLLVSHQERSISSALTPDAFRIIEPFEIGMVSYPYEWSFGQLKDAAMIMLEIQKRALAHGMTLKDASAYNIQFHEGRPILIDTLSFERHREGAPWIAYRQFCQHFLAPLALMSHVDVRLGRLLESFLDGVPLDLASVLLPKKTWARLSLALNIHLHARSISRHAHASSERVQLSENVGQRGLEGLLDNLETAVRRLDWNPTGTEWAEYEVAHGYSSQGLSEKERLVLEHLEETHPRIVWDLGSNTGLFSRLAARGADLVVAIDGDPAAVEILYRRIKRDGERRILPLWIDLTNPTPALGWAHEERYSLLKRGPADMIIALALIHHLAITANLPLESIAKLFANIAPRLIIEFVPKSDPQVQRLLASREDVFVDYNQTCFERIFSRFFKTVRSTKIQDTNRWIYSMQRIVA